jgi:peptidoglycan/xylan/chitin deacetylase (PgdA/CDA1 family)
MLKEAALAEARRAAIRIGVHLRYAGIAGLRNRLGAISYGPRKRAVALTFDDGPSPDYTPRVLEILRAHDARATFFVLGARVEEHSEIARAVAMSHEIGCHSFAHDREIARSLEAFRADVARCRVALAPFAEAPRFYRFPWGEPGRVAPRDVLDLEGMRCVHWSASSGDDTLDADAIVRRLESRLEPGAILLLHDGVAPGSVRRLSREATIRALPRVLAMIAVRGLRACSVGDLLGGD